MIESTKNVTILMLDPYGAASGGTKRWSQALLEINCHSQTVELEPFAIGAVLQPMTGELVHVNGETSCSPRASQPATSTW